MDSKRVLRIVVVVAVTILAMILWQLAFDRVWPAPTRFSDAAVQLTSGSTAEERCVDEVGVPCGTIAKKKARQFRKGKLGNSEGYRFPPRVRKKINKKMDAQARPTESLDKTKTDNWWDIPFQAFHCAANPMNMRACRSYGDNVTRSIKDTTRVTIVCGGQAVIGFVGGKATGTGKAGWWGAGIGSVACLWDEMMDAYYD